MKLVIDICESFYNDCKTYYETHDEMASIILTIANGTPLPQNYGRLIDADELSKQYGLDDATKYGNKNAKQQEHSYSTMMMYEIANMIDDAPTIIEADKGDKE